MTKMDANKIEKALLKYGLTTKRSKNLAGCLANQDFSKDKKENKKKETFIDLTEVKKDKEVD